MRAPAAALVLGLALSAQEADPLAASLARAGDNAAELRRALAEAPAEQRGSLAFLVTHMPERDLRTLAADFLLADVALAHAARAQAPWTVPDAVFLDAVLPYAHLDETREAWRASLRATCLPLIAGCTRPGEAACRLNEKLFGAVNVRYSTQRRRAGQSPSETMAQGLASCTGLSILLADACRSVGVPARLAGIASWPGRGGNHTWVEVWDEGWHFLGAAEPDPAGLDRAWFADAAAGAVAGDPRQGVYAVCWRPAGARFVLPWAPRATWPNAVDASTRYAKSEAAAADDALRAQLDRFFAAAPEQQATFEFDRNLDVSLADPREDERLRTLAWAAFRAAPHAELRADHAARRVRAGGYESPFRLKEVVPYDLK
jgi:transglutaminase-like putative cysteine protease